MISVVEVLYLTSQSYQNQCKTIKRLIQIYTRSIYWLVVKLGIARCMWSSPILHGLKVGGLVHGEREARAYNWGLGLCPQWGPGAKPLVRGEAPLELTRF